MSFQAFDVVERSLLESIDDVLAEKASLQSQLPEVNFLPELKNINIEFFSAAKTLIVWHANQLVWEGESLHFVPSKLSMLLLLVLF